MKKPAQLHNAIRCALRPEPSTRPGMVVVTILYNLPLSRDGAFYTYSVPATIGTVIKVLDPFQELFTAPTAWAMLQGWRV